MDARRERRGITLNLSGKEKAQLLLSVLGDQSKDILNKLSPEAAEMLMSEVGSAPKKDSSILSDLLREIETVVTPPAAPSTSSFKEVPSVESTQTAPSVDDELAPGDEDDSMADTEEEDQLDRWVVQDLWDDHRLMEYLRLRA